MYCKHCGKQIDANSKFCPGCGGNVAETSAPAAQPQQNYAQPDRAPRQAPVNENSICCPYCGSYALEISSRSSRGIMEKCWACLDCGYKFSTPEDLRNKAYTMHKRKGIFKVMLVISLIAVIVMAVMWVVNIGELMDDGREFGEAFKRFWKSKDLSDFYIRGFSIVSVLYLAVSIFGLVACGNMASKYYTEAEHTENNIKYAKEHKRT